MKTIHLILLSVTLLVASCGNNENEFDATGTFEATEVTVSAQASGTLLSFIVNEGDTFEKDVTVGNVDDEQIKLQKIELGTMSEQLTSQASSLANAAAATDSKQLDLQNQIAVLQQQIANNQRERQRYSELVADGAVPRKQLDEINYQISVQEKQLGALREQLNSNNASLGNQSQSTKDQIRGVEAQKKGIEAKQAQLDRKLHDAIITTPIAGTIIEKYAEQGEFVTVGKPLFKIADTNNMFIRAYVTTAQLKDLKIGKSVKVFADYGNGEKKTYNGTIAWISNHSEFTPKTILTDDERADLVYAVKIAIKNDGFIKIGMYGEVKF